MAHPQNIIDVLRSIPPAERQLVRIDELKPGMTVRHKGSSDAYLIHDCYGNRATGVRTIDITNPVEWEIIEP